MKFLDEVKRKAQENMETMVKYDHATHAKFKGNKVIITPDSDYSKIGLFANAGMTYVDFQPIVIDLGKEPVKAHLTEKVTHYDTVRLLEAADAEKVKGLMYYKAPLEAFRLSGFPKELNDNLEHVYISHNFSFLTEMSNMSNPEPTVRFRESEQEILENAGFIEKEQIVKGFKEWPKAPLKRKPTLVELETLSKQLKSSELSFDLLNNEKSKLEKVNEAFDFILKSVRADFGQYYHVNSGGTGADIIIEPPFEKSILNLEEKFGSGLSYGSLNICH